MTKSKPNALRTSCHTAGDAYVELSTRVDGYGWVVDAERNAQYFEVYDVIVCAERVYNMNACWENREAKLFLKKAGPRSMVVVGVKQYGRSLNITVAAKDSGARFIVIGRTQPRDEKQEQVESDEWVYAEYDPYEHHDVKCNTAVGRRPKMAVRK